MDRTTAWPRPREWMSLLRVVTEWVCVPVCHIAMNAGQGELSRAQTRHEYHKHHTVTWMMERRASIGWWRRSTPALLLLVLFRIHLFTSSSSHHLSSRPCQ